jgi:hypothetical protein
VSDLHENDLDEHLRFGAVHSGDDLLNAVQSPVVADDDHTVCLRIDADAGRAYHGAVGIIARRVGAAGRRAAPTTAPAATAGITAATAAPTTPAATACSLGVNFGDATKAKAKQENQPA